MKELATKRLILRSWSLDDVDDMYAYAKRKDIGPNAGWPPHKSKEESRKIIQLFMAEDDTYAIVLKETRRVIGSLGIHKRTPDPTKAKLNQREIGYVLNPDYWGNGYVPEAVKRVVTYCFEEMGLDLLWCGHYDDNMKSKRVNEKCGFAYQFAKEETVSLLDNKKVSVWYYLMENPARSTPQPTARSLRYDWVEHGQEAAMSDMVLAQQGTQSRSAGRFANNHCMNRTDERPAG